MAKNAVIEQALLKHQLDYTAVYDVQIHIEPVDDPEPSDFTYDISVGNIEQTDGKLNFRCLILVGRKKPEEEASFIQISAGYVGLVSVDTLDKESAVELAKLYAGTTIWATFSQLFGMITNQMRADFPRLPPHPGRIEIQDA